MSHHVVETDGLSKNYGKKQAITDFTINIPRGGTHAIIGSNGAGKSTLFRLLLGIQTPSSGTAKLLGECSRTLSPQTRARISYVNEEHTLPLWMTAGQITQCQRNQYPHWNETIYRDVLKNFDVQAHQLVGSLSRGERAGLNLSMALGQMPELLILDEPTLGMDVVAKQSFLQSLIFVGSDLETTVIYCSHQMEEVERLADSLIIMEKGRLRCFSTPDEFRNRISYWILSGSQRFHREGLAGLLTVKEIEDQIHLMALDRADDFSEELRRRGAETVERAPLNFEQAVNAFLAKNHEGTQVAMGAAT